MNRFYKYYQIVTILLFLIVSYSSVIAQEEGQVDLIFAIPEVAMIDIEPAGYNIELSLSSQTEAGLPVEEMVSTENSAMWLNYTSSLATGSNNRSVSVQLTNGKVPNGVRLQCTASPDVGNGGGTTGRPTKTVNVLSSPRTIIKGIGRCYTGNGVNSGHQITYSLVVVNYSELDIGQSTSVSVAYTISDN